MIDAWSPQSSSIVVESGNTKNTDSATPVWMKCAWNSPGSQPGQTLSFSFMRRSLPQPRGADNVTSRAGQGAGDDGVLSAS